MGEIERSLCRSSLTVSLSPFSGSVPKRVTARVSTLIMFLVDEIRTHKFEHSET